MKIKMNLNKYNIKHIFTLKFALIQLFKKSLNKVYNSTLLWIIDARKSYFLNNLELFKHICKECLYKILDKGKQLNYKK